MRDASSYSKLRGWTPKRRKAGRGWSDTAEEPIDVDHPLNLCSTVESSLGQAQSFIKVAERAIESFTDSKEDLKTSKSDAISALDDVENYVDEVRSALKELRSELKKY